MSELEAQTRREIINVKLLRAGWKVGDRSQVVEEFGVSLKSNSTEFPHKTHQFIDYVLLGRDGQVLAVVEAKKTARDAEIGREQAKQYCYHIRSANGGKLPFCFYTNGHEIFFWDLETYPPIKVTGFPTRDDLERYVYIRENRKLLSNEFINTSIAGRDYQVRAIRSVMEALDKRQRKFLLVMATGTGKTRTCITLIDTLMRAHWIQRVLFLVDRVALRDQALSAFKEYLPNEPKWPKVGEKSIAKDRRIYVATYPTMLNIIRSKDNPLSPHFFDLIVVDESHRSIYNTYQEILDYFHSLSLGLTATPTDLVDHNTFTLFNCANELPTFAYSYLEAVENVPQFLCNFQVMKIHTRFQDDGISKRTISLDDQKQLILEGKEIEEINFEGSDLEKKVTNRGTNVLIVKQFMEHCIKDDYGVLPGKTIFFCSSVAHARRIEEIFDSLYPQYHGELAKVLVSDDPRVYGKGGLLDQFTNNNMPRVAISVDMLDTGIDVREIVNLVFAKPVYTYTKFWQMIGRGSRLLNEQAIKPWCPQKDTFLIIDCWDNFEYFKISPKGRNTSTQIPLPVKLIALRLDKIQKSMELNLVDIARKEVLKLRNEIQSLPLTSIVVIDAMSDVELVSQENFWGNLDSEGIEFLHKKIKPLFRALSNSDFKAMKFEKDVLQVSLAALTRDDALYKVSMETVIKQISQLPLSVNTVAQEEQLINRALTNRYWAGITDADLDELIDKLSPLMKFRDTRQKAIQTHFNLKDIITTKEIVEFGPELETISIAKYRQLVEQTITELLEQNSTLKKLKNGQPIIETEIESLADTLHGEYPHVTEELLRTVYKNHRAKFVEFMRHILGVERLESFPEIVERAFEEFVHAHSNFNARQLDFLYLLKEVIMDRVTVQKRDLIQSPFTLLHPKGIRGLFSPLEVEAILKLTEGLAS